MADSKVTDFSAATSVASADVLYLIQNSTDKKISVSTLLANLPNTLTQLSGLLALGLGSPQTIANAGTITTTGTLTLVSNEAGSYALTLNNGTYVGQLKLIMCTAAAGVSTISSNIRNPSNIVFSAIGHTALLIWYDNDWWVLGGRATGASA